MSGEQDTSDSEQLLNQQIAMDRAALETKRRDLYERSAVIRKQAGVPDWLGKSMNRTTSGIGMQAKPNAAQPWATAGQIVGRAAPGIKML